MADGENKGWKAFSDVLKEMVSKEFKTEVGRCNIFIAILLLFSLIILLNSKTSTQLTNEKIFVGMLIAWILFVIFCMVSVFIMERIYLKHNNESKKNNKVKITRK